MEKYFGGPLKKVHYIRSIILSNFLRKCLSYRRSKIDIFRPHNSVILYCMTKFLNRCHGEEILNVNNFCSVCVNKIYTSKTLVKNKDLNRNLTFQASQYANEPFSWYRLIDLRKMNKFVLNVYIHYTWVKWWASAPFDKRQENS